ncbi:hypothetical protein IHO40_04145 [Wolbachia endosymbiont of Mansonella ozzardi]|uniref:hypothetical protein n=1 Tax=Wolbachia endosymbiont of Mansonella ozzardi TaxID=137464 RepID=UPI001CE1D4F9|nr:hypothetical protein [Wolbachia endosymbiont of Mansonella ozzardi]MCA4775274.1 hypothetical protein [Wolbachia endosymbiont of Mansonella ozzardi]
MLKSVTGESQVKLTSYEKRDEDSETAPKTLPQVAFRTITPGKNENKIIQPTNPFDESNSEGEEEETSRSLDSGVDNRSLKRSVSEGTIYSLPWDNNKILEDLKRLSANKLSSGSGTPPTLLTPKGDGDIESSEIDSTTPLINSSKKTNRFLPRVKYAMQQKGFIISSVSAIVLGASAALVSLQDKAKFIPFFTNSSRYVTIPVIVLASLLAIIPIFCAIKQFRNTDECQTQGKNSDEILDEMLELQPKDKVIKSVRLEYSNGTHSNFALNAWKAKNGFINIDEKVISRTNKIESVINNRPIFTALLTGVVVANIALPLGLLAIDGVNNVQKFYRNLLNHNVGLSLLIGSGILTLLIICLGVHYHNKTNCTNLISSLEEINTENVNKEFIKEIKRERTNVLEENHSKDAKRSSLTLEQVVVQSHNYSNVVYGVGG